MSIAELPTTHDCRKEIRKQARRDLSESGTLGRDEARYLVDTYYQMQDHRKATANQQRSMSSTDGDTQEPHRTIGYVLEQMLMVEEEIRYALDNYSADSKLGQWARSQHGVGPVIAAGLLAHIDIARAPTAGAIWRFAGLDPSSEWKKGEKRPWNADLKVLCWKIGDSFVKFHNNDKCFYGKLYAQRKVFELERDAGVREVPKAGWYGVEMMTSERNIAGESVLIPEDVKYEAVQIGDKWFAGGNAAAAAKTLEKRDIRDKATRAIYESGHLPPGRLDLRARRWAVKLFLAHYQEVGWEIQNGTPPPDPYPISHLGHAHRITPPGWPM